ncbi:MAG: metal ABC transporter permease [Candidatus Zixiibacteriota bacterium]|nr:MAG: metal ABC transporter permease [candidate division Zixibacteria bacterium]
MSDYLAFLLWPFIACLVLVGIHVYFGLHIIKRGIIFVDLSLAQVAALGMTVAFLIHYPVNSNASYLFSLGFALTGAAIFTMTRGIEGRVPQEAIIGIVYAVSSAAAVLAVSHSPEGAEHIRYLLVGSILTVTPADVAKTAGMYAAVGLFHWLTRRRFLKLTFDGHGTTKQDRWWDFLFYATFAIVVTSSVKICGVLLVFIFLVVPSVSAALLTDTIAHRLFYGWAFGLVGAALGLVLSFELDTPSGGTIVWIFGVMLLIHAGLRKAWR